MSDLVENPEDMFSHDTVYIFLSGKMSRYGSDLDCKIYVGDLARDTTERDLERAFSYYGKLRSVWVARNPAGFGFVEYDDTRDAEDAVRGLDGS